MSIFTVIMSKISIDNASFDVFDYNDLIFVNCKGNPWNILYLIKNFSPLNDKNLQILSCELNVQLIRLNTKNNLLERCVI